MDDLVKVEENKLKKTEELTKAVMALTNRFEKDTELAKKKGIVGGTQRLSNSLMGTAKEKMGDTFSAKGVAGLLGFKQGGMIMNLLGARHESMKEAKAAKVEEASRARAHAENYMKYNVEGRELAKTDPKAALEAGVKNYEQVKAKQEEIDSLKAEIARAEKTGHGDVAKQTHGATLEELERQQRTITTGKEAPVLAPSKGTFKAKPQTTPQPEAPKGNSDIIEALIALGYGKAEANAAASALPPDIGVSDGIKAAMKSMSKEPTGESVGTPKKVADVAAPAASVITENTVKTNSDITEALVSLGYSKEEANKAAKELPADIGVSDGIKAAMKSLTKVPEPSLVKPSAPGIATPITGKAEPLTTIETALKGGEDTPQEELVELAKQQLEALNKLVSADTKSKEDKLEEKNKDKPGMPDTKKSDKKDEKKKESKGIFGSLLSGLEGLLGGGLLGGKILAPGKLLGGLAKSGGVALLRGAGSIVKGAGSLGMSALKGAGALATTGIGKLLGTGTEVAAKGAETVAKTGEKVAAKELGKVGAKGLGKSILKKIPGIGLLAGLGFAASRLMDGDVVGAGMEVASGALSTIPGIGTAGSIGMDAALAARDMGAFDSTEVKKTETELSKPATTPREAQTAQLEQTQKRSEQIAREKAVETKPASTAIVNNTNVNNNTNVSKIQAPVRNFEPSYNRRLDYTFGGRID